LDGNAAIEAMASLTTRRKIHAKRNLRNFAGFAGFNAKNSADRPKKRLP
jgi:hypothetical protein